MRMKRKNRMKRTARYQKILLICFAGLILLLASTLTAFGFSSYSNKLPDNAENYSCSTCHSGSKLNEFGVDFEENEKKCDDSLMSMDSDGDGFTNEEEFNAESPTNPGDANSYPGTNDTTNTTVIKVDTSAFIGPFDMKFFVPFFFGIITVVVIGSLIGLVAAELVVSSKKLIKKMKKSKERKVNGKRKQEA
jgi:hypothetical protein